MLQNVQLVVDTNFNAIIVRGASESLGLLSISLIVFLSLAIVAGVYVAWKHGKVLLVQLGVAPALDQDRDSRARYADIQHLRYKIYIYEHL